jgi:tetratricopeptide (TPR) repeat protein
MPHPRNEGFVGREALLAEVERSLRPGGGSAATVALTQALSGLGGVGKTQLAIRYVHDHAADYDAVLWVAADPPARLASDFADLARAFGLPEATRTTDVNAQIRAVREHLQSPGPCRWLLVFDNADDPDVLRGYLPTRGPGHVLVTSRRAHWPSGVHVLRVRVMERRESIALLLGHSGLADAAAAAALAEALGDFPLALAQAAGYLKESGMALGTYLDLFRERRRELLDRGTAEGYAPTQADAPDEEQWTVFATLDLAMRRIDLPEAEDLLGLIACLAPDAIPRSLLAQEIPDPLRLGDAIKALGKHSLIQVGSDAIEAHRLVQAVALDRMSLEAQSKQAGRAVTLLERVFPRESNDTRTWGDCRAFQPHADKAASLAEHRGVTPETVGELLDRVGIFDEWRARFEDAEARYVRALAIKEAAFGVGGPSVAGSLNNLGRVLRRRADLAGARRRLERALRIEESAYGPEHPRVASILGNLGNVAFDEGDLAGARRLQERALRINESAYGPEHADVASTLGSLGIVAGQQGDLAEARRRLERALGIEERAYGPNHSQVARTLGNLGIVAQRQGDLDGARRLQERALRIEESAYGPDHPEVARTLTNLGNIAIEKGDLAEARRRLEQALGIKESAYGPEHPQVAITLSNLGIVAGRQGDLAGARRLMERALRVFELAHGPDHPHVASALGNLGNVAKNQGDLDGARRLMERALRIFRSAFGDQHPSAITTLDNLRAIEARIRSGEEAQEAPNRTADEGPDAANPPTPG